MHCLCRKMQLQFEPDDSVAITRVVSVGMRCRNCDDSNNCIQRYSSVYDARLPEPPDTQRRNAGMRKLKSGIAST